MTRRGYVRAVRVCAVYAALVASYLFLFLPFPPLRPDHVRASVTLAALAAGSILVAWSVGTRSRPALYIQAALAVYGALMMVRIPWIVAQLPDSELRPAVVISYALTTSIGITLLFGFAAVWKVDRIDRAVAGQSSSPSGA